MFRYINLFESRCYCSLRRQSAAKKIPVGPTQHLVTSQVIDEFSGQSFRLLALAKGVVKGLDRQALAMMTQEQLEQQAEFELVGLLVLSNHLRPDSKETITQLQQQ